MSKVLMISLFYVYMLFFITSIILYWSQRKRQYQMLLFYFSE